MARRKIRLVYPELITVSKQDAIHSTDTGTTDVTVVLFPAAPKQYQVLMGFQASSDAAAANVQILDGATVVWEMRMGANQQVSFNFNGWLVSTLGNSFSIAVTGATAFCSGNLYGFTVVEARQ